VVPAELGAHAAQAGSFMYMEFAEFHPVTYMDEEISHLFLEKEEESAAYQRVIASLEANSLDVGQSRDLIAKLAVELYANGEGNHDFA
jgi:uncharacterized protein DUF5753